MNLTSAYLHEAVRDTERILINSDIFVLATRYEGFSNSLTEAMALGVPCITTDCPGSNWTITEGGISAILLPVEDVVALSQAMILLLNDERLRTELGVKGLESMKRFREQVIVELWEKNLEVCIYEYNR